MLALLLLPACDDAVLDVGDAGGGNRPHDTDTGTPDDTGEDTGETDSGDSGDTDDTDDIDTGSTFVDCDSLPETNLGDQTLSEARAYHGISFDDDGHLIGWDGRNALVKSSYDGTREVFVPGLRGVEGMDRLPDGDWVIADSQNARLARVTADGGTEALATNIGYAYGVTVGPDQKIYYVDGGVHRLDPTTGEVTTLFSQMPRSSAHVVNFNLDSTVMYIGTIGRGDVFYVELDEYLDPVTDPAIYASGVGTGWHDGLGVDACGNLYVADYYSSGLYKVATDGTVTSVVDSGNSTAYGHGLEWGSGHGGWRDDALYQPQPYGGNKVREVVIGVPSGDTVRTWNGVAVPW